MYLLMNLMSDAGISILTTVSVLGYCLLPMVILAFLSLALPLMYAFLSLLSLSHTHTHTHTLSLSLSLTSPD